MTRLLWLHNNYFMNSFYYDVDCSLGFLTITSNRLMNAWFKKRLGQAGIDITAEQWGVLVQLWNKGSIAQDELAYIVCVDKSSLSRVLEVMERRGLVRRERDPADARRKTLYATDKANALRDLCLKVAVSALDEMLNGISREDLAACITVLTKVKKNIRKIAE